MHTPDGSIEPDVEHFILVALQGDWSAPLEVSCNAARLQSISHPRRRDVLSITRPLAYMYVLHNNIVYT